MSHRTAKIISYIFQPLFMPLLTVLLAFGMDPLLSATYPLEVRWGLYAVIALNTFLVPTAMVIYLKKVQIISSLDVENRKERFIPFILTLGLYAVTYWLLRRSDLPRELYAMMFGSIVAMVVAFVITLFWKISIHMTGIGGVIGTMCALFQMHFFLPMGLLSALILLAGAIGTARMVLSVHTLAQVICGSLLGFITQFTVVGYLMFW
jgi:hypothetical protein